MPPRVSPVACQLRNAGLRLSNASWLNWIECEFAAQRYLTLDGRDRRLHRWANRHVKPKRRFAVNSKMVKPIGVVFGVSPRDLV